MILIHWFIAVVFFSRCYGEESVYIVVLNVAPLGANENPRYHCYQTRGETTPRTYGRYVDTRNDDSRNLEPNPPISHCCNPDAQIVNPVTSNGNGFGIFYCRSTQPNKATTTVPTIFLRNDAVIHPKGGFFTKTVNQGDTVTIETEPTNGDTPDREVHWRFNGSITPFTTPVKFSHTIADVSAEDEGVYETYYYPERNNGQHSIMRLIVRGCPASRWGPPNCHGICDKCYNGGICDDKSGKCVCPPGFRGENCLTACGGNSFGRNCEVMCSTGNPRDSACSNPIFCLPDPYGCTCNTGYYTLDCGNACPANTFGAGCTQECHCTQNTCNIYTGECGGDNNVCLTGWSGGSCQIPDVCESDYYGPKCTDKCHCLYGEECDKTTGECPGRCADGYTVYGGSLNCQECRGSTYGFECIGVCRCDVANCDKVTGDCNGGCLSNWVEPDCQTGIQSLSNIKVNPNQESVFTCTVVGSPIPSRESVILERQGGTTNGITYTSESTNGDSRSVLFDVKPVAALELFVCRLMTNPGAYINIFANTFVLPGFITPPRVSNILGLSADIEWDEWNSNTDDGDPPVVAYRVHYKPPSSSSWTSMSITGEGASTTVTGLRWETEYMFSISAVREGEGGEGPRGPSSSQVSTTCADPLEPHGLQASSDLSAPKEIMLQWEEPDEDRIRCSAGITEFTVYYRTREGGTSQTMSADPTEISVIISGLETYTEYMFEMTMSNSMGTSGRSAPVLVYSPEEEPPPPEKPTLVMTTPFSVTVYLRTAQPYNLNGNVSTYVIEYQKILPTEGDKLSCSIKAVSGEYSVEKTIQDLTANSNYYIRVHIVNGVGKSPWSEPAYISTYNLAEGDKTGVCTGPIIGSAVGWVLFLLTVFVLLAFVVRKKIRNINKTNSTSRKSVLGDEGYAEYKKSNNGHESYQDLKINVPQSAVQSEDEIGSSKISPMEMKPEHEARSNEQLDTDLQNESYYSAIADNAATNEGYDDKEEEYVYDYGDNFPKMTAEVKGQSGTPPSDVALDTSKNQNTYVNSLVVKKKP